MTGRRTEGQIALESVMGIAMCPCGCKRKHLLIRYEMNMGGSHTFECGNTIEL